MTDWEKRRDELADKFHIKNLIPHPEDLPFSKDVYWKQGFNTGRSDTLERIKPLIEALEFYANPNRHPPAVRMFTTREEFEKEYNIAREALANWRKEMD